jgi:hypothetical protein
VLNVWNNSRIVKNFWNNNDDSAELLEECQPSAELPFASSCRILSKQY